MPNGHSERDNPLLALVEVRRRAGNQPQAFSG